VHLTDAIRNRRSVRRYADRPVEKATIEALLDVAVQAPSASNQQPWAFVVIQGAERIRGYSDRAKLIHLANPDISENLRARMTDPAHTIFYGAPALVCIYAKRSGIYGHTDCAMAGYTLMLAAHGLGLGTCWIGMAHPLFDSPELKQELGVPLEYSAVCPLILGYPEGELPPSRGRNTPEVLHWE
jgi:nitroreductase